MSKADVLPKAAALEEKLKGKLFLEGSRPTAADVKAFNDLLGDKNTNLFRWVKHVASFTEAERAAWGAPSKKLAEAKPAAAAPAAATAAPAAAAAKPAAPAAKKEEAPKPAAAKPADDDDIDLFGEETEEEKAALEAKKAKDAESKKTAKKAVIAKSSILLDVKVWEDSTDLEALAAKIKSNERDGLLWGAHKLAPVAFGVKKLQILLVIEDDKVSSDDIEEMIVEQYAEEVQSMDVVAWNKV